MPVPAFFANPLVQMMAVTLFSSILGAATRPKEEKYQSASDKMLDQMVADYTRIGKNREFAASLAAMVDPSRTKDSFLGTKGDVEVMSILRADSKYKDFEMFPIDDRLAEDITRLPSPKPKVLPLEAKIPEPKPIGIRPKYKGKEYTIEGQLIGKEEEK